MRFTIDTSVFDKALKVVSRAIPRKSTAPHFEAIEITATANNELLLRGTDMEIELETKVPSTVHEPGRVLVSGHRLAMLAAKLPEGEVEVFAADSYLELKYGRNSRTSLTLNTSEVLPKMKPEVIETTLTVPAEALAIALQKVLPSVAVEAIQPVFKGVLFDISPNIITLVATDAHRLATAQLATESSGSLAFILPRETAKELLRLVPREQDEKIEVKVSERVVSFTVNETVLSSRLIEGQFPDYKKVIPREYKAQLTVQQEDVIAGIERCSLLDAKYVTLDLSASKIIQVMTKSDAGMANEVIPVLEQKGESNFSMFVNPNYLLDALRGGRAGVVQISVTGPFNPIVITAEGSPDLQLILPIRIEAGVNKTA